MNPSRRRALCTLSCVSGCALLTHRRAEAQAVLDLDVPFVVTPDNVVLRMLDMAQTSSRDSVLDLGSGDGRIVITAALRYGARASGIEIDPQLVARARGNAERAGIAERAQFSVQDLFEADLGQATVITMYLLPDVNIQLRPKLLRLRPGTRIVSHDWDMGDWSADHSEVIDAPDKPLGLQKKAKLMLWVVPAQVGGRYRTESIELDIEQEYQMIRRANLRIDGGTIRFALAIIRGPSVVMRSADRIEPTLTLSAFVNAATTRDSNIEWRLARNGQPDRHFSARRE